MNLDRAFRLARGHERRALLSMVGTPTIRAARIRTVPVSPFVPVRGLPRGWALNQVGTPEVRAQMIGPDVRVPNLSPILDQFVLHGLEYDQLGFSLKPPKWLRKAQPGKILKKIAVPAALVGAMFIPGVAPAALAVLKGAGGLALKGGGLLLKGGKVAVGGATKVLGFGKSSPKPPAWGLPAAALRKAASIGTTALQPRVIQASPVPTLSPMEISVPAPIDAPVPYMTTVMPTPAAGPDVAETEAEQAPQAAGGMGMGIALIAGVALLAMAGRRRR